VALNVLITWGLSGLWHGAAWNFVLWGLYHGLLLYGYRQYSRHVLPRLTIPRAAQPLVRLASVGVTFLCVCVGWTLFALSLPDATLALSKMFGFA
jgi:alginate O-acetyltransferase complex protein AlgI